MTKPQDRDETRPEQQETEGGPVPRTPNERDTSADSQKGSPNGGNAVGKAAHDDATSGRQDTSKSPEMDATYDKVSNGKSGS